MAIDPDSGTVNTKHGFQLADNLVPFNRHRMPDIDLENTLLLIRPDNGKRAEKTAGYPVFCSDLKRFSIVFSREKGMKIANIAAKRRVDIERGNIGQQLQNRVVPLVGIFDMRRLSHRHNLVPFEFDALRRMMGKFTCQNRRRRIRNDIRPNTSGDALNRPVALAFRFIEMLFNRQPQNSFFRIDQRKSPVRRKTVQRDFLRFQVTFHAAESPRFLIEPDNQAEAAPQLF